MLYLEYCNPLRIEENEYKNVLHYQLLVCRAVKNKYVYRKIVIIYFVVSNIK